jgi:NAD(P)-dependent dehydrogenase (short-subunit alcohol dehydrogenase family)
MNRFQDKTVLVTGGTRAASASQPPRPFAAEGARVVITGRDAAALGKGAGRTRPSRTGHPQRCGRTGFGEGTCGGPLQPWREACAPSSSMRAWPGSPAADVTEALWDETFDVNVRASSSSPGTDPAAGPGASIVINGSINAHIGMPNSAVYAASKAAVISLAKTLSAELLPRGARVNVVSPGPVHTPLYGKLGLDSATLEATAAQIQAQIPLGRFGTPDEIASTVLHLSAPESAFIVGTEIIVDGGMSQL